MPEGSDNKRRASRLQHELPVAYRSVGSFLTDWATDISQGGMFINTRAPLPVGTDVKILIQLQKRADEIIRSCGGKGRPVWDADE